jgi:hypothetical protein
MLPKAVDSYGRAFVSDTTLAGQTRSAPRLDVISAAVIVMPV